MILLRREEYGEKQEATYVTRFVARQRAMLETLVEFAHFPSQNRKTSAYGYRDHEFFKLKILGAHETRYALVG